MRQSSYEKALPLTQQEPERRFRQEQLRQLNKKIKYLSIFDLANDYLITGR